MTKSQDKMSVIVRGEEDGQPVEFTAGSRETAERLVKQLEEQGVLNLSIEELN